MSRQDIIIVGAGMAGLIAGNILRRHHTQIVERSPELPNNHHAVLRFRTTRVSDACHIPFREVRVHKMVIGDYTPIQASMLYSKKVTGRYELRSIKDLQPVDRFIAPVDFIAQASASLNIAYGVDAIHYFLDRIADLEGSSDIPLISTMPMPALMSAMEYPGDRPNFSYDSGWTARCRIPDCDVHITAYVPDPSTPLYRASITGDELILEFVGAYHEESAGEEAVGALDRIVSAFGLDPSIAAFLQPEIRPARYAKLGHLSPKDRKLAEEFMYWASTHFNVYSLGRFATWRSGLLLDDVVSDVLKIERWITGGKYLLKKGYDK